MIFAIIYLSIGLIVATIAWCAITFMPERVIPPDIDKTGMSIESVRLLTSIVMLFFYPIIIVMYLWDKNK